MPNERDVPRGERPFEKVCCRFTHTRRPRASLPCELKCRVGSTEEAGKPKQRREDMTPRSKRNGARSPDKPGRTSGRAPKTPRTATKTATKATGARKTGNGGKAGRPSRGTGPGQSTRHRSVPGELPEIQTAPEVIPVAQKHMEEVMNRTAIDPSVQDEEPTLGQPSGTQRTRRKHRAAAKNTSPAAGPLFHASKRAYPPKPTGRNGGIARNAERREAGSGTRRSPSALGPNRFVLQRREKQAQRRFSEMGQHAGKANFVEKASQTPMWAPAAPLRKNTYIGSPGPWNETPRVDGNVYRGKPMPPELAPGLDLYGTNEGGLTELFDEGGEGGEEKPEEREERGESEQSVDDNDVHADVPFEMYDGEGIRETLPPTPASVQTMLHRMRTRIREQEAYIQDLEDQILKLNNKLTG